MALDPIVSLILASSIVFVSTAIILILWWYMATAWMRPLMMTDKYVDIMVEMEIANFWLLFWRSLVALPGLFINAIFTVGSTLGNNLITIGALVVLSSGALIWIEYHDRMLESYYVARQCYMMPTVYTFLLPVFNVLTMIYDSVIPVIDFYVNLHAFYWFGFPIILFKCAINTDVGNVLFYFSNLFSAFFIDLNNWIIADPLTAEWNILISCNAFGFFVDTLPSIFSCFCSILDPFYQSVDLWCNEPSVHFFFNCFFNFFIRVFQLIIATFQFFVSYILPGPNPVKPNFTNITLAACCTFETGGDAIEDTVFLILEMLWGIFSTPNLPPELLQFVSTHYMSIISRPLCGIAKVANMTAVLFMNINDGNNGFLNPDGSGIQYLQFGHVADEFKIAAIALGSLFYIFNIPAQYFVQQLALSIVDGVEFLLEWIPGNVMFFIYSAPSDVLPTYPAPSFTPTIPFRIFNFLFYYFPNYWVKDPPGGVPITLGSYTYSSSLSDLYTDTFMLSEAAGDLVSLVNSALGCVIEHLGKSIVTFIAIIANIISFIFTILFFQPDLMTTARAVQVDVFFQELTFLSACLGELVSQFGNCTQTQDQKEDNLYCCTGRLITKALDTFILLIQQLTHFFQDMVTLPTGTIQLCLFGAYNPSNSTCIRIPNLAGAIYELNQALCAFSCAIANIIPVTIVFDGYNCVFPPIGVPSVEPDPEPGSEPGGIFNPLPIVPCASVTTCIANVICTILQVFTVPLTILNQFFIQMIEGNPFNNLFDFLNNSAVLFATAVGNGGDAIAMLIDCALCAFGFPGSGGPNGPIPTTTFCSSSFFTIMHYVFVVPFVALAGSFGIISFYITRLFMSSLKQLFDGLGYFAIQDFIVKLFKFSGIYSYAADFWFTNLFSRLGLPELGSIIHSIDFGLCDLLETTIDVLITEVTIVSLGLVEVPDIFMCCDELFACVPLKKRFDPTIGKEEYYYNSTGKRGVKRTIDGTEYEIQQNSSNKVFLTPDTWIKFIITNFSSVLTWPITDECNETITEFQTKPWNSFTKDDRYQLYFCVYKVIWPLRTDNQTMSIPNSTCNDALLDIKDNDWSNLRFLEKSKIFNCILDRFYVDMLRQHFDIPWFPQDWWSNPYRRWYFTYDLFVSIKIYFQYVMDQSTSPQIMLTPAYQSQFSTMGLNTTFYNNLTTLDDILIMRTQYHLEDYFIWNGNASQYKPIVWISTTFWKFVEDITISMSEISTGFSDNITDPSVYLQYGYTGNVASAIGDGLVFYIFSSVLTAISKFAKVWSDPINLRKRDGFLTDVNKTFRNIINGASREVNLMSIEAIKSAYDTAELYYGECPNATKTEEFIYEYEKTIHGLDKTEGRKSIIYRLSQWWVNFTLPSVNPLYKPSDGKIRNGDKFYHNYTDEITGEIKKETIMERIFRFIALVRKGNDASNYRYNKLTSGFKIVRDRVYTEVIKNRINKIQKTNTIISSSSSSINNKKIQNMITHNGNDGSITYHNFDIQRELMNNDIILSFDDLCKHYRGIEGCSNRIPILNNNNNNNTYSSFFKVELFDGKNINHTYNNDDKYEDEDYNSIQLRLLNDNMNDIIKTFHNNKKEKGLGSYHYIIDKTERNINKGDNSGLHINSRLLDPEFTSQGLIHIDGLLDLTCTSNISFLCTECFYLDQLVGRVVNAIRIVVEQYEGQYGVALNQTMDFFAYEFNINANARVGDSVLLPVLWPWVNFDNFRILGDTTPNKIRFNDIANMTQSIENQFDLSIENSTLFNNVDTSTINGIILSIIKSIPPFRAIITFFYNISVFLFSPTGITDAEASVSFVIQNWLVCDWNEGTAFNGEKKRFSIGETFFGYFAIFFAVQFLCIFILHIDIWSIITGTAVSLLIFFFSYLSVTYNWAWTCWWGMPYMLMKDINYFFVNTLFTKCDWLFSGLVLNVYTNTNCVSCAYTMNITMANCQNYGFTDIFSNIVFFLQYFYPDALQWIRDQTTPIFILYQIPFVNERLNQFVNVNMNDPVNFARYWTCSTTVTLISNLILGSFFLVVLGLFYPVVSLAFSLGLFFLQMFISLLFILYYILQSFFVMIQLIPFFKTGIVQTTFAGSDGGTNSIGGDGSYINNIDNDNDTSSSTNNYNTNLNTRMSSPLSTYINNNNSRRDNEMINTSRSSLSNHRRVYNSSQQKQQQQQRPQKQVIQRPLEYNNHTNSISLEYVKNVIDRTRMRFFGGDDKNK